METAYVTREVEFPRELDIAQANRFFTGLGGLVTNRTRRLRTPPPVIVEVIGYPGRIRHLLHCQPELTPAVWGALRGAITHVGLAEVKLPAYQWRRAVELYGSIEYPQSLDSGQIPTLLGALTGLGAAEAISLQLLIDPLGQTADFPPDVLYSAIGRLAAQAGDTARAEELLGRLLVVYNSLHTFTFAPLATRNLSVVNELGPQTLIAPSFFPGAALAVLSGLPLDSPSVPGLRLGVSRRLVPEHAIPSTGRCLLMSNHPAAERPLTLAPDDRLRHVYLVGPTGTGKSTVMERSVIADIHDGYGVAVIDPKRKLVENILERIPKHRVDDVVLLDLADTAHPVGFNVLAGEDPYIVMDEVAAVCEKLFPMAATAPRAWHILRRTLLTLAMQNLTLCDLPLMLDATVRGQRFRARFATGLADRELEQFWQWFDHDLRPAEKSEVAAPVLRRMGVFGEFPQLKACLGQATTGFNMDDVLAENKILLVPLGGRGMSEQVAGLVGSLVCTQLWRAVTRRTGQHPFYLYVDQFEQCLNLPVSFREMCDQARGYSVGLTLAHTIASDLPADVRRAVFGNVRTKLVFQTTSDQDARLLAAELGEPVTAADITNLGTHEVIARLMAGGRSSPAVTGRTLKPFDPVGLGDAVRAASRQRYGRPAAAVLAELDERHGYGNGAASGAVREMPSEWDEPPEEAP